MRAWFSRNGLTIGGVAVSLAVLAVFGLSNSVDSGLVPRRWQSFAVVGSMVWLQILTIAGWRWNKRRASSLDDRVLQGLADLRSLCTRQQTELVGLRAQQAFMRAEMHALLEMLPEGVISYADRQAIRVSIDALQNLASTGTDEGRATGVATVTSIADAIRGRHH
jgi:hypothetical protein